MEVKITDTAKKTAGLLRATAEVLQDVRSVAVELNPEAADVAARELAPMIAEGISERIDAVQVIAEEAKETAESAAADAGIARAQSNNAIISAGTAKTTANAAKDTADAIKETADNAQTAADNAQTAAAAAQDTADAAKATADSNKALLDAITASAVWPKPNDTAPLRIVATQDKLQGVVSRGELVWASEDADVIKFTRAEGGTGTATVALDTTDKNYSLTLGAGESKAVLPATITGITTSADNDIEHVRLKGKLSINGLQFNQKFPNLKTADLAGLDVSEVTSLNQLFYNCQEMTTADVSGWDTSSVTNMGYVFYRCFDLATIDVSSWDTSSVTNMQQMFKGCSKLTTLDVSGFDTSNVTNMANLFQECAKLTSLIGLSGFDTGNVTNFQSLFYGCSALTTLDVSGWDTSSVTNMGYVFYRCFDLATIDVSSWDTSSVTNMLSMFYGCSKLTTLDVSGFDTSKVTDMGYMFYNCYALTTVTGTITGIKASLDLRYSPLTNASAMVFINGLAEVTTAKTITFKATTYATLTEEQIAVATSKGWTVASA